MLSFGRLKNPSNPLSRTQTKNAMNELFIGAAVAFTACICGCMGVAHIWSRHTEFTLTITHNPVHSAGSDEPEDPVDFSSKPKSSATNLGS